ncbi:MAG: sortase [Patescibacteria group bacterium]
MTPENLPTMETMRNNFSNHYQSDWWLVEKIYKYLNELGWIESFNQSGFKKFWKLSLSTTLLILIALIGFGLGIKNRETIASLFPSTSHYAAAAMNKTEFLPEFFNKVGKTISDKYNISAAMIYLKKISTTEDGNTVTVVENQQTTTLEKPLKVIINKIGVNTPVVNPTNTNLDTLNTALDSGAVRYPSSGLLGENKNIFIFGHSTSLQTDKTYYKTFNGLDKLVAGDEIIIESATNKYIYKVTSVKPMNTEDGAILLDSNTPKLTLSTCNTLGTKEDRHVVEANLIKVTKLDGTIIVPPVIGGNTSTPTNNSITAGETQTTTYTIDPVITDQNNPSGRVDFEAVIDAVGILDSKNEFVATTTFKTNTIIAVKFTVKNIGNKTSDSWNFNAVLPTSPAHIFHSGGQKGLKPNEKIEFTMGFDKAKSGDQQPIIINVDPAGGIQESNKANNINKIFIDIKG